MDQVRMDAHRGGLSQEAGQARHDSAWGPLDFLRSLGRAATIASGLDASSKEHPDYRGFRILTTGRDGSYRAHVTPCQGGRIKGQLRHDIDAARFGSHDEAAQYIRFLIVSGALQK